MVRHFTDDKGGFLQPGQLTGITAAVARDDFIPVSVLLRTGKARHHDAVFFDGFHHLLHLGVVLHLERVRAERMERMQLRMFQIDNLLIFHRAGRCGGLRFRSRSRAGAAASGRVLRPLAVLTLGHFVSFSFALFGGGLICLGLAALAGLAGFFSLGAVLILGRAAAAGLFALLRVQLILGLFPRLPVILSVNGGEVDDLCACAAHFERGIVPIRQLGFLLGGSGTVPITGEQNICGLRLFLRAGEV